MTIESKEAGGSREEMEPEGKRTVNISNIHHAQGSRLHLQEVQQARDPSSRLTKKWYAKRLGIEEQLGFNRRSE